MREHSRGPLRRGRADARWWTTPSGRTYLSGPTQYPPESTEDPESPPLTDAGWLLVDWGTALLAPPERDLWSLDPGDGTILDTYASATGVAALPSFLDPYSLRWDIADIAVDVSFADPMLEALTTKKPGVPGFLDRARQQRHKTLIRRRPGSRAAGRRAAAGLS